MDAFERALTATSTPWAPWYVIPADSKNITQALVALVLAETLDSLGLQLAGGLGEGARGEPRGASGSSKPSMSETAAAGPLAAARAAARDGDVRARRRHVADERLDLGGGQGPRHDRQQRPVGDRARGAGLRRVHPHREQVRRPVRPQARVRARPARLRRRGPGHGRRAEHDRDHHLLGDRRRARRLAAAAGDAVAHPRQLRRRRAHRRSTPSSARPPRSPPRSGRCSAASSPRTCRGASRSCSRSS